MRAARGVDGGETSDAYSGIGTKAAGSRRVVSRRDGLYRKGARNATYDDNRHGATTLFAALNNAGW